MKTFGYLYGERNKFKTKAKEIIMKGLSKPYDDKVRIVSQQRKCWMDCNIYMEEKGTQIKRRLKNLATQAMNMNL